MKAGALAFRQIGFEHLAARIALAILCLISIYLNAPILDWEGTEASGGYLTGPLISVTESGLLLLLLALIALFVFPRPGASICILGSLLCLPIHLYSIAPVPFGRMFAPGHEFEFQPALGFHWNTRSVIALLTIVVSALVCVRIVGGHRGKTGKAESPFSSPLSG